MLFIQRSLQTFGGAGHIDGADTFVRVLRVLFRLIKIRLFGHELLPEFFGDVLARPCLRLRGNAHRVGSDIGNERDMPFFFGVDALV